MAMMRAQAGVKTMLVSDVPSAMCTTRSAGNPCRLNRNTISVTRINPPPIPSMPAKKPTNRPISI